MLSERSKIPPRPGIILPESFCPARRLKALSMRSEAIETTERGIRTKSAFQKLSSVGSNGLKMSNKSNPTRAAKGDASNRSLNCFLRADDREFVFAEKFAENITTDVSVNSNDDKSKTEKNTGICAVACLDI